MTGVQTCALPISLEGFQALARLEGIVDRMALLTASSSVCMSLRCGLAAARVLGRRPASWAAALRRRRPSRLRPVPRRAIRVPPPAWLS